MVDQPDQDDVDDSTAAKQIIDEIVDRKPSPYPRLLMWTQDQDRNARVQPTFVSPSTVVSDYFEFARGHALPANVLPHELDRQLLPLLFVYRHAIELALKYLLAQLRVHIRQHESEFEFVVPAHHRLGILLSDCGKLFAKAKPYLDQMGEVSFLSAQACSFVRELDLLDPKGEAFRYSHSKPSKAGEVEKQISASIDVNVDALRAGMLHIEKELLWLIDMVEITSGLYAEWTADMLADFGW